MADIFPDIKPGGLTMKKEVDLWAQLLYSLEGLCTKLDADGAGAGVPMTDYLANCYTAIINTVVRDSKGNRRGQWLKEENFYEIGPNGITDAARLQLLYNWFNAFETLTEQLDTDVLTDSTYEALCYTAIMLHRVWDTKGNVLGNGVVYDFGPGGTLNQLQLVECYYNMVNAWETLTEQLDGDGVVADGDYEALWFTATVLTRIENGAGSVVGQNTSGLGGI